MAIQRKKEVPAYVQILQPFIIFFLLDEAPRFTMEQLQIPAIAGNYLLIPVKGVFP